MTFGAPIALATLAKVGGVVAALLVVAYVLKLRRRRFEVPFSRLWQKVLREDDTTTLWKKLRRLLSLAVQLAFVALLLGAALDPQIGQARTGGRDVVVLIDTSASMKAKGPDGKTRLEGAKVKAREILAGLGAGDAAMILQVDARATARSRFEADPPRLQQVVDRLTASDTPADLPRGLRAAADALRGRKDPLLVIIGDGAYPERDTARVLWEAPKQRGPADVDLSGLDVRFAGVGSPGRNVGITAFNVRRYLSNKLSVEALLEVENFGEAPEVVKVTLSSGDDPFEVSTITVAPGAVERLVLPDLAGGDDRTIQAKLEPQGGPDALATDDVAWALLPAEKRQKVLLVTQDNLYLEGALLLDEHLVVDKITPAEYPRFAADGAAGYDVVMLDGFTPDTPPKSAGVVYFGPDPAKSPIPMRGVLERPLVTDVDEDHPITRWVSLADVNMDRAHVLQPQPGDVVLARSIRDPLIVAGRRGAQKVVVYGFSLAGTDLTLRVAFPMMIINLLDWFAGEDAELLTTYRTGDAWAVPVELPNGAESGEVTVATPEGTRDRAPVEGGRARVAGRMTGVYTLTGGEAPLRVAANLASPEESNLTPASELTLAGHTLEAPPTFHVSVSRKLWVYAALAALALILVEWVTYHRRVTV